MGYTKVYLWTEEIPEYYERLGFHYIKDILKNDMVHTKLNFPNELGTSSNYDIEYDKERRVLTEGRRINNNTFRFFEIPFSRRDEYFTEPLRKISNLYYYDEDYNLHKYKKIYGYDKHK